MAAVKDDYRCPISEAAAREIFGDPPSFDLGAGEASDFTNTFAPELLAGYCATGIASTEFTESVDCNPGFPVTVVLDALTESDALRAAFTVSLPTPDTPCQWQSRGGGTVSRRARAGECDGPARPVGRQGGGLFRSAFCGFGRDASDSSHRAGIWSAARAADLELVCRCGRHRSDENGLHRRDHDAEASDEQSLDAAIQRASFTGLNWWSPAAFVEAEWRPWSSLLVLPGLRADYFGRLGEWAVEPRMAIRLESGSFEGFDLATRLLRRCGSCRRGSPSHATPSGDSAFSCRQRRFERVPAARARAPEGVARAPVPATPPATPAQAGHWSSSIGQWIRVLEQSSTLCATPRSGAQTTNAVPFAPAGAACASLPELLLTLERRDQRNQRIDC
jgi:hypothetical protein